MRKVGEEAPGFDLPTSASVGDELVRDRFRLSDHSDRWVVVYFFPKSFTPACAREATRFRDNGDELKALGADVVGISTDGLERQCAFAEKLQLKFPLASDLGGHVARAYGVLWPLIGIAQRATFIVGPVAPIEKTGTSPRTVASMSTPGPLPSMRPARQVIEAVFWHEVQVNKHLDEVVGFLRKANGQVRT